jgi:hypothetical protein
MCTLTMFIVTNGGPIMQLKKLIRVASLLLLAAALASCNIGKAPEPTADVNAIFTSAAGTMFAQLNDQQTQTALAVTDTPAATLTPFDTQTPMPTFASGSTPFGATSIFNIPGLTPGATIAPTSGGVVSGFPVGCNNAELVAEKIPDKTVIAPAKQFTKTWQLQNTGTCTWDEGYSFDFKSGEQLQGEDVLLTKKSASSDFTAPGHSQSFNIDMWTPGTAGEYKGYWQMKSDKGEWFGSLVWVDIIVHR